MTQYFLRRVLVLIPILLVISFMSFGLLVAMPGDPLDMLILGDTNITQADIEELKELYGLNDPFPVRYLKWLGQVVQGNLGFSRNYHVPVMDLVGPRVGNTLVLTGLALVISLVVAIPIGTYSATRPYSPRDYVTTTLAMIGYAVPGFWLGLVLIIIFGVRLQWLPAGGLMDEGSRAAGGWTALIDRARHLALPVFVLGVNAAATWTRYMRASLLEVMRLDYIKAAQAKGLTERQVIFRHALRNALIPMVTLFANTAPSLVGGSIIIETVFAYPGVGKLLYDSVLGNDFSVSMAVLMFLAVLVVLFNLLADLTYGFLDPRIRYE
jgi:peptide/nickel transport system permease protein